MPFIKLEGRLGIPFASSTGDSPAPIWCDGGTVSIIPELPSAKVLDGNGSWSAGETRRDAAIDSEGRLTYDDLPYVEILDLTADDVNPSVAAGRSTHRVERDVTVGGKRVKFPIVHVRIAADTAVDGVCDLTTLAPLPAAGGVPMVKGDQGASVASFTVDEDGLLVVVLDDGTTLDPVPLPPTPLIPDPVHAGFFKIGA